MPRPYALLRAGFPYVKTIGMRRITSYPMHAVVTADGAMFVLCRGEGTVDIRRTNWDDEDLGTISGKGTDEGKLTWPVSMAMDGQERLYVSDEALHRITIFDTGGECLGIWGEKGSGSGQLDRPSGIAFDADGDLLVVDTLNHRVQRFTSDGGFLAGWGAYGEGEGQLNMPWGICVDDQGDVYVADWRNDRVQKFAPDGRFILSIGGPGAGDGEFNRPAGVAADADGDIYVADWGNDRVQQFAPDGRYVDKFIGDATLSESGIAYLMANARPMRYREMSVLEPQKRLRRPTSVIMDGQGRMFITDYGSYRVQVYQKQAFALTPDQIAAEPRSPTLQTT